jgi:hypothetical protein
MASPTQSEIQNVYKYGVDIAEDYRSHVDGTQNAQIDTLQQAAEGDWLVPSVAAVSEAIRGVMSSGMSAGLYAPLAAACVREFGKLYSFPEGDDFERLWDRLFRYCNTNTIKVASRQITFGGAVAGVSNVGSGTINRLSKDELGYDIEATFVEVKTAKCIVDGNTIGGYRNAEVFEFYGTPRAKDLIAIAGSGQDAKVQIPAYHCGGGNGRSLLQNASFSSYNAASTSLTGLFPGWTIAGAVANLGQDTTNYYRSFPGASVDGSLKFVTNERIYQRLSDIGERIDENTPYYLQLAYNRQVGSGDGTLTIRMGSKTASVSLAAQTGWNILRITIGTDCWYRNFAEDQLDIEIELASRTTGYTLIDDVIFAPFTKFDGIWYAPVGGATPFRLDDSFTFTDTGGAAGTGKIQYWTWRWLGKYWPHATGGSVTWADP